MAQTGPHESQVAGVISSDSGRTVYNLTVWDHAQLLKAALTYHGEHNPLTSTLADVVELSEKSGRLVPVVPDTMGGVPQESSYFKAWKNVVKPPRIMPVPQPNQKQTPKSQSSGGLSARAINQLALPPEAVRFRTALMSFLDRPVEAALQLGRAAPVLDLRRLFIEVLSKGGSVSVTNSDLWPDIAAELVHDSKLVNELRQVYSFYLLPLETSMPWGTRAGRIIEYIESKVRERAEVAASGRTAQRLCESTRKLLRQAYGRKSLGEGDGSAAAEIDGRAAAGQTDTPAGKSGSKGTSNQDASTPEGGTAPAAAGAHPAPADSDSHEDDPSLGEGKAARLAVRLLRLYAANPLKEIRHADLLPGVRSLAAQQLLEEEEAKLTQQHFKQKRGLEADTHKEKDVQPRGSKRSRVRHRHHKSDEEDEDNDEDDDDDAGIDTMTPLATLARQSSASLQTGGSTPNDDKKTGRTRSRTTAANNKTASASHSGLLDPEDDITLLAASHALVLASLALRSGPPGCGLKKPPLLRKKVSVPKREAVVEEPAEEAAPKGTERAEAQEDPPSSPSQAEQRKKSPWTVTPKCGDCKTCRNPKLKKACMTNRERLAQGLEPIFIQEPLKLKDVL